VCVCVCLVTRRIQRRLEIDRTDSMADRVKAVSVSSMSDELKIVVASTKLCRDLTRHSGHTVRGMCEMTLSDIAFGLSVEQDRDIKHY